ncbi:MAG: Wzy polymerase domain-containing protein [Betaproteobacteria bacterium]|jgi:O-antigen ligase
MALALIGLAWVLPFLSPNFLEPISSFYGEATAIVLGLAALTCLYSRSAWPVIQIPRASLVFLGFAGLILLDVLIDRTVYPQQNLLAILYLVWAVALAALGWRLKEIFGLDTLVATLAWFVLAGALLSAAIGLAQWWGIPSPLKPFMLPQVSGRIFANTGQPNHLADYICLGVASLIFLGACGRIRLVLAAAAAAPLLMVLVASGSRSAWLYLGALAVLALLQWLLLRSRVASRIAWLSVGALVGFLLAQWVVGALTETSLMQVESIASRVHSEGIFSSIRLRLWHEAWLMFRDAPLLGQGFRQFPWQHFLLNAQLPPPRLEDLLYDNAHNLLMQTLAEFGLAGAVVLAAGIAVWALAILRNQFSAAMWWLLSALAILSIHSMLEYPLWYAYFLGIVAVLLGASESAAITIGNRPGGRLVPVLILLLGWMAAANTYQDYRTLQSLHRIQSRIGGEETRSTTDVLLDLQQHSLFTPFVELALSRLIVLNREQVADKIVVNEAAMHFAPAADVVYRQAVLRALDGKAQEAHEQWDRSVANYPGNRAAVVETIKAMAASDARMAELLEYANTRNAGERK